MEITIGSRFKRAWNAFLKRAPTTEPIDYYGSSYGYRPDRVRLTRGNERSIINSVINRIAMDVASVEIHHVELDDNQRYLNTVDSELESCLSLEANVDQSSRDFIQDIVMTMLDEGVAAVVPTDTSEDPNVTNSYDIYTMRVGTIKKWYPQKVDVELYNEHTGRKETINLNKRDVAIIENPFYSVMNEPNSIMRRVIHKLNLLDAIDEQSSSGKLDLIIQLPYQVRSEGRKRQADERMASIESQLSGSKYGIAYTDGTERITQLNRPVENNLMSQIEYLMGLFYAQLGITQSIMDGTADEKTMLNYYSRTIEPILTRITLGLKRKFITKTARSQGKSIEFFRDPFKLVPISELADMADKFTRNEILTPNEIRQIVGMKPSSDERADELRNRNISEPNGGNEEPSEEYDEEEIQNGDE